MNPFSSTDSPEMAQLMLVVVLACLAVGVYVYCLYLRTLSRAVRACAEKNRAISPGHVWLNLIPFFSVVYAYVVVNRVAETLKAEHRDRRLDTDQRFGRDVGLMYLVCYNVSAAFAVAVLLGVRGLPPVGDLFNLVGLALWIRHWVEVARYGRVLRTCRAIDRKRVAGRVVMA